jgi:hypothetical protein
VVVLLIFLGPPLTFTPPLIKAKLNIGMDVVADAKKGRAGFSITCDDAEKMT